MIRLGLSQYLLRQTVVFAADGVSALMPSHATGVTKKRMLIVDSDVSFFRLIELPQGAKVSREFVELNYLHLSPFEEAEFCYVRKKQYLLLWFYPAAQDRYLFAIPEGYVLWKVARSQPDAIYAYRGPNKVKLFVIRDGILRAQFVKAIFQDRAHAIEEAVAWAKEDSSLGDLETVVLEDSFLHQGIKTLEVMDLVSFMRIELDRETLFADVANAVKWPLLLVLSTYLATGYALYWGLSREISNVKAEVMRLQTENLPLKKRIEAQAGINQFWKGFLSSESAYPYFADVLDKAAQIIEEQNGNIMYARFAENRVSIGLLVENVSMLMEKLLELSCFEKVTVSGAVSKDAKTGKERAVIEGVIKRVTKDRANG